MGEEQEGEGWWEWEWPQYPLERRNSNTCYLTCQEWRNQGFRASETLFTEL